MTDDERLIGECLRAAVEGPFFPDWEFATLFGLTREQVAAIAASWPTSDAPETQRRAVNNALNMLLGYPHNKWDAWREYISAPPQAVADVYARWRGQTVLDPTAKGVFDRFM